MTITAVDLQHFLSETTTSGPTNGGLPSENQAVSGQKNNTFSNVSADDRETGIIDRVKIFGMVRSTGNEELSSIKGWLHGPTPGDDYVYAFKGTKTDTEADLDETTIYAAGTLAADIAVDDTAITVTMEATKTTEGFHADGKIAVSNKSTPSGTGTTVIVPLSSTPPLVSGLTVTLYLEEPMTEAFSSANTIVASVMEMSPIQAKTGTIVVTSASGSVDESSYPPVGNNKGTRDEELTVSFSTTTNFTVSGTRSGALGSGTVSTDFVATNPINGATLLTIPAGFFSSTGFIALDTVTIPTIGANFAYWETRVVPEDCDTLAGDQAIFAYTGESD